MSDDGPWKIIRRKTRFSATPYVVVSQEHVLTHKKIEVEDFYRVELAPFSVCVPQLVDGGVVTLWQYKHGPRRYGLSFPAGYIEIGENAQEACARELLEETGCTARKWRHLGEYVDNGNQQGSVGNYFFAQGCEIVAEPSGDDLEDMEIRILSISEIDTALAQGEINIIHHVAAWGLARPLLCAG